MGEKILMCITFILVCMFVIYVYVLIKDMPVYQCTQSKEETICRNVEVCKAPGKGGQCWFYDIETRCHTKSICVKQICIKNCD